MRYPSHLLKLMEMLKKLPSVGRKTAERFAFDLVSWKDKDVEELGQLIAQIKKTLTQCARCGCLTDQSRCNICIDPLRQTHLLCIVSYAKELYNIESTGEYRGVYHILGGKISPMERRGVSELRIESLKARIIDEKIKEVILALDATLEGDATSLYLKKELEAFPITISRLAFGIPMGSALEFIDEGTLARAFKGRNVF